MTEIEVEGLGVYVSSELVLETEVAEGESKGNYSFAALFYCGALAYCLGSLFLAVCSLLFAYFSLLMAILIVSGIFDINYFTDLSHVLILVGFTMSAATMLNYNSVWRLSEKEFKKHNEVERVNYCFGRSLKPSAASHACAVVLFACNMTHSLVPTKVLCLTSAFLLMINLLLSFLVLPALFVWYERNLYDKNCKPEKPPT
mmetsp:Transcript_37573/g.57558  ORF Transcript_37573/g.57558 Transcript_37573/m.57558 type:complete len:201 (+) Transcript_37573:644-1246(+)